MAADLVARVLLDETLMTEKLARRGLRVRSHYEPDVFSTTTVATVMRPPVGDEVPEGPSVAPTDTLVEVLTHLADDDIHDVPVVDRDGTLVGVCTRHDLLTARLALLDHERPQPGWLACRRLVRPAPEMSA